MATVQPRTILHDAAAVRTDVDRHLRAYYSRQIEAAAKIDPAYHQLWQMIGDLALAGGKRLRPYMIVLAYEMYGGTAYEDVLPVAAASELLHLSLLIHDDITDQDTMRYGQDNIIGSYQRLYEERGANGANSRHFAESAALLAGDLLLSAAHSMILESGLPMQQRSAAHAIMSQAMFEVAAGQLLDMEASLGKLEKTDAFKIAQLKTASYSFVAPLTTGAALAGVTLAERQRLAELGNVLGLAYQLSDDLLGVFGDQIQTGKSNLSDLQEGKRTYLMQLAYDHADAQGRQTIDTLLGQHDLDERQAAVLRSAIVDSGARQLLEHQLVSLRQQAEKAIDGLSIGDDSRLQLTRLMNFASRRQR